MATAIDNARVSITATNTAQALASAQEVAWVLLWAPFSNEQVIRVGKSTVTNTNAATEGLPIIPGAPPKMLLSCDLADLYVIGYIGDKIYYLSDSGTSTSGTTVVQATAANLNATVTSAGWTPSAELGVGTNVVKASAGILHGFLVEASGANNVTVQFYNHASTATTPITPSIVVAAGDKYGGAMDIDAICSVGIVCVHSGTNGIVTAYYA